MVVEAGPPVTLGPAPSQQQVHQLRDFWASPASGSRDEVLWQQTMGSMVLRLLLKGPGWRGVTESEFQVRLCELGLRVSNKRRPEVSEDLLDALNGDFTHEVLARSSWWSLEVSENEASCSRDTTLMIHLAKAKDRSWKQPFLEAEPAEGGDLSSDWVSLQPGRRGEGAEDVPSGIRPADLFQELAVSQTEELVILRLFLSQSKLDEVKRQVPMSRLWGLDLTQESLKVFLRGHKNSPLVAGRLGGKIVPQQTDWNMIKVTRERETGADGVEARETLPVLSIQLRKASDSRHEWADIIIQDSSSAAASQKASMATSPAFGELDEDGESARLLELEEEGAIVNREGWTAEDHAKEMKARGDDCFKKQNWEQSVEYYTRGLGHTPDSEKLLSNRSAAYVEMKRYQEALDDAMRCADIAPEWPKSFFRQGIALRALKRRKSPW
mmetsp:Transcript_119064/g.210566  ORF Transcript_119064/g.210566 Transcript_119064/m.210566 type:complete len:440 (+) Transcript_119064:43-1362(+)